MRQFAFEVIKKAAMKCGLAEKSVINLVKKDNLTIERPRVEVWFMPESLKRTGRTLAYERTPTEIRRKVELYEVELLACANVLAEDDAWLADFCRNFLIALPNGQNDRHGNWVKVRAVKSAFSRAPDKRVGEEVIEVFSKVGQQFDLTFRGRITEERVTGLIPAFTIKPEMEKNYGQK